MYRGLFHVHHHIIPIFDKNNKKLKKNIKKYFNFLKEKNIRIVDFTWHSHLFCLNPKLKESEISYFKLNLSPLEIFKIIKKEAKNFDIIVIPTLEVTCLIKTEKGGKEAHILVMHEDENLLYGSELMYKRYFPFENFFHEAPQGSLIVLAHPWRFGCGMTYFLGTTKTNEIIKNYHPLIENNGWIYPWYYALESIFARLPFLKKIKSFKNFYDLTKKNFELSGLENYVRFYGMDTHAPHLLPGNTGFIEMEMEENSSIEKILNTLREGKLTPSIPQKIGFWESMLWMIYDLLISVKDEIILEYMIKHKFGLKHEFTRPNSKDSEEKEKFTAVLINKDIVKEDLKTKIK